MTDPESGRNAVVRATHLSHSVIGVTPACRVLHLVTYNPRCTSSSQDRLQ